MAQNNFSFELQQLDSNGALQARRRWAVSETEPTAGEWRSGKLTDTNETTVSFVAVVSQVRQLVLVNTSSTQKITVKWTPQGGSEATINKVGPGGMIAFWDDTAAESGLGISSLKLTADVANATFELFIGG